MVIYYDRETNYSRITDTDGYTYAANSEVVFESTPLGEDGLIQKSDAGASTYSYFLKDHLGSTRMVLNESGGIKEALMYQPYGTVSPVDGMVDGSTDPLRKKFTGKEYDEDGEDAANGVAGIEAYHFGFRMYDPEVGVWMSADPKVQYWNTYSYGGGNPVNGVDPNGMYFDLDNMTLEEIDLMIESLEHALQYYEETGDYTPAENINTLWDSPNEYAFNQSSTLQGKEFANFRPDIIYGEESRLVKIDDKISPEGIQYKGGVFNYKGTEVLRHELFVEEFQHAVDHEKFFSHQSDFDFMIENPEGVPQKNIEIEERGWDLRHDYMAHFGMENKSGWSGTYRAAMELTKENPEKYNTMKASVLFRESGYNKIYILDPMRRNTNK